MGSAALIGATTWVNWKRLKREKLASAGLQSALLSSEEKASVDVQTMEAQDEIIMNDRLRSAMSRRSRNVGRPLMHHEQLEAFDEAVSNFQRLKSIVRGETQLDVQRTPVPPDTAGVGFARTPDSPNVPPPDPDFYGLDDPTVEAEDIPPLGTMEEFEQSFGV